MSVLQFPPIASLAIAGFVTLVGIGQAVLFGGDRPRTASLIVGTTIYSLGMLAYWLLGWSRFIPPSGLFVIGTFVVIGGAILGYLSGTLIGGVFLLAEYLRRFVRLSFHRRKMELSEDN